MSGGPQVLEGWTSTGKRFGSRGHSFATSAAGVGENLIKERPKPKDVDAVGRQWLDLDSSLTSQYDGKFSPYSYVGPSNFVGIFPSLVPFLSVDRKRALALILQLPKLQPNRPVLGSMSLIK